MDIDEIKRAGEQIRQVQAQLLEQVRENSPHPLSPTNPQAASAVQAQAAAMAAEYREQARAAMRDSQPSKCGLPPTTPAPWLKEYFASRATSGAPARRSLIGSWAQAWRVYLAGIWAAICPAKPAGLHSATSDNRATSPSANPAKAAQAGQPGKGRA